MIRTGLYLVILCSYWAHNIAAKDLDGEFVVFSVGADSCNSYIKSRLQKQNSVNQNAYKHWISGYLTAFNLIVVNTYDIVGEQDYRQLINWLDRYCALNQKESFANALAALTVELYPDRRNMAPNKDSRKKWVESGNLYSLDEVSAATKTQP